MPIKPCDCPEGGSGRQWGDSGKCFCGKGAAAKAGKQAAAAHANGFHEDGASAASPRFDEAELKRLLEKCRRGNRS